MKNETSFAKFVQRCCRRKGFITFKTHGHIMQKSGWPDLEIFMWGGRSMYLELKFNEGKVKPLQKAVIEDLRKRGHCAGILRYRNELDHSALESVDGSVFERWSGRDMRTLQGDWVECVYEALLKGGASYC